jgi:hypothetical protein
MIIRASYAKPNSREGSRKMTLQEHLQTEVVVRRGCTQPGKAHAPKFQVSTLGPTAARILLEELKERPMDMRDANLWRFLAKLTRQRGRNLIVHFARAIYGPPEVKTVRDVLRERGGCACPICATAKLAIPL